MARESTFVCDSEGRPLAEFAAADEQWRMTLAESEISPHLFAAVVAAEDARFYDHRGVDWRAAVAAVWQDAVSLRFKRGGSTITMQLHRLRQGVPHSLLGKFEQAVRAAQIEDGLSKRAILVEYLNRAPFGGNLVGAGAASWRYFGRSCGELSLAQAALLAGLPKNPTGDRPDRFVERARARRDFVLGRMLSLGLITSQDHARAVAEPVEATWRPLPQRDNPAIGPALPMLTRLVRQSAGGKVQTTLDLNTQQIVTTVAREHLGELGSGVNEVAVLVVESATAKCLAAVSISQSGASDLDLTQRPRSTGSVIKPLIYAAAFDAGIASPRSLVDDSPAAWPGYAPSNYDLQFRGRLTAGEALAQSRNIPALRLLSQVGVERAVGVCAAMGLRTVGDTPGRYGLSLAVGGAEATCAEIAEAYMAMANGGVYRPLKWQSEIGNSVVLAVAVRPSSLSERACRDVLDCLSDPQRTALVCPEAVRLRPAWKTGTSSGHRDAWCAAVGPTRVVVVWMGNANAAGSQALVGAEIAAPLALRLLAGLDAGVPVVAGSVMAAPQLAGARVIETHLAITSPANQSEMICQPDVPAKRQKILLRATLSNPPEGQTALFWFKDGSFIGTCAAGESLWWQPVAGEHDLRVTDSSGRADEVKIKVRMQ